jgi:hypothetical protein
MKRIGVVAVCVALGLASAAGCGKATDNELGGETHWLMSCDLDVECGSELACHCGVCTVACTDEASCSELGAQARCVATELTPYAEVCDAEAPELVCARTQLPDPPEESFTVEGARYVETDNCFGPQQAAGTGVVPPYAACPDALTHAVDAQGNCWLFRDGCLPEGFAALDGLPNNIGYACRETFRSCEEPLACGDQQVDLNGECVTCTDLRVSRFGNVSLLLETSGWDTCSTDADCVMEPILGSCEAECDRAVSRDSSQDFRNTIADFLPRFCGNLEPAAWAAQCGEAGPQDCSSDALCSAGRCREGTRCADRNLEECETDGDCAVSSAPAYDSANSCFAQVLTRLACVDSDLSCPPVITPGLDAEGNCYAFGNCLPPGFTPAPGDHPCRQAIATSCTP